MNSIQTLVRQKKISRLCHLTPFQNLLHIARGDGLRSTRELSEDQRAAFQQQDLDRLDGYPDHISCSIEYPNVWYLAQRRSNATPLQRLFPDWVCVLINPSQLWRDDTLYCPRNAAAGYGTYVAGGIDAFQGMFAESVLGSGGRTYRRGSKPPSCPTDDQAEVLVHKAIPLEDCGHIVVADDAQARRVLAGLDLIGAPLDAFRWRVAPEFFERSLSRNLAAGVRPREEAWELRDDRNA